MQRVRASPRHLSLYLAVTDWARMHCSPPPPRRARARGSLLVLVLHPTQGHRGFARDDIGLQTTLVRAAEWHPARDIASDIFWGPQRQCNEPNSREHTRRAVAPAATHVPRGPLAVAARAQSQPLSPRH